MSLFRGLDVSASGLQAERARMEIIAENIANVQTSSHGGAPYRRKEVVLASQPVTGNVPGWPSKMAETGGGVRVLDVIEDQSPLQAVYRPQDPAADANGYVYLSNVNLPLEMVDMVVATRAYEANAAALKAGRELVRRAIDILR